ncbi:hypothetical protein BGX38DRAFT_1101596 [Terfezia claveryi]|nr:hypothetical protein BGX38DRAFT_1101596 [Terfezia claveryi]
MGYIIYRASYNAVTHSLLIGPMPCQLYNSCQPWLMHEITEMTRTGWLTPQEVSILDFQVGTKADLSSKQLMADALLQVDTDLIPSLVVEAGWSESFPKLRSDVNIWMDGGGGATKIAILVKFTKHQGHRFGAFLEVARYNAAGGWIWENRQHLFPTPPNQNQYIAVSRAEIFGNHIMPGRNLGDVWNLDKDSTCSPEAGLDTTISALQVALPDPRLYTMVAIVLGGRIRHRVSAQHRVSAHLHIFQITYIK